MIGGAQAVVLDTSVVSILFEGESDLRFSFYQSRIEGLKGVISFQTLEEVWFGAFKAGWGERRQDELKRHLADYDVIWPDNDLVSETARLRAAQERKGRRLGRADAWIAATALWLECPLAAHDRDFVGIDGLTLIRVSSG